MSVKSRNRIQLDCCQPCIHKTTKNQNYSTKHKQLHNSNEYVADPNADDSRVQLKQFTGKLKW